VNLDNIINHTNPGPYNGALTSRFFGLANGALQTRRIELALRFNFQEEVREQQTENSKMTIAK